MKQHRLMSRVAALVLGLAVAIATLSLASAQQEPPHRFYGHGATAGDTIGVVDDMGDEIASTTVDENGSWWIDVDRDAVEGVTFTLNGKSADAEVSQEGADLTEVTVTAMVMEEPAMEEGEEGDLEGDEEGELTDLDGEEPAMEDETNMGDTEYPGTGSGGLADGSGVSAGLIGLLIALSVAAVAGLGLRRVRNRA